MTRRGPSSVVSSHLYIVAGYPASGKSSCLAQAVREHFPLFGKDELAVIPKLENIRGFHDRSNTADKLKTGYWVTLIDIGQLNRKRRLPRQLILHLDLLLAYLSYRPVRHVIPNPAEVAIAFARLFAQPALRRYERYTVTTVHAPIEEIQRRWHERHRAGYPDAGSGILADKKRLITETAVAGPAHATIYAAWDAFLAALSGSGKLDNHFQARTRRRDQPTCLRTDESP